MSSYDDELAERIQLAEASQLAEAMHTAALSGDEYVIWKGVPVPVVDPGPLEPTGEAIEKAFERAVKAAFNGTVDPGPEEAVLLSDTELRNTYDPETFQATFQQIFDEAFRLLVSRQKKYGPENVRSLGFFGVFGRLADDKVERIRRALNGKVVHGKVELEAMQDFQDESVDDSLLDLINYGAILLALKRGQWGKPLA